MLLKYFNYYFDTKMEIYYYLIVSLDIKKWIVANIHFTKINNDNNLLTSEEAPLLVE